MGALDGLTLPSQGFEPLYRDVNGSPTPGIPE